MTTGTPISRHCIVILKDGTAVVDWGNSRYQDLVTGQFLTRDEADISRIASNEDLDELKATHCLEMYDEFHVYIFSLPEWDQPRME